MPTARGEFGIAVVSGKIYVIGGIDSDDTPLGTVEEYNPATNQWITKTSMPTPRSGFAVAVIDGKIYAIGGTIGNGYLGNNEMYNPVIDRWETKSSMPTPRAGLSASTVNGEVYLIGGEKYSNVYPFYAETGINEVYDPVNDTWSTRTSLPTAVKGYASAVIDNKIYVIGGAKQPSATGNDILVINNQVYDTQTDSWNASTKLPFGISYGSAAATTGFLAPQRIYFIGGFSAGALNQKTLMFNPTNQSWSDVTAMPTPREYLQAAVLNDVIYAIGGYDGQEWLNTNEQYKPVGYGTIAPKIQITSPENKTYTDVPLSFELNRGVEWTGYSIDDTANVTLKNQTITLSNLGQGAHKIVLYANDSSGNMGTSNTVFFSVDTLPPSLAILSPSNQTYGSTDIQLTFILNEATTALTYSLDGGDKIDIQGNVTLPALANGAHHITVYATDEMGNSSQETIYFDIEPFPFLVVVATVLIIIIAAASGYLFFVRRKTGREKQATS
ncbi:MAG: Kelch repeat-containing protein [Candidatus Bathyarchaeia archaeon]|jgi:N-acetylneuraminic acid mutarotase